MLPKNSPQSSLFLRVLLSDYIFGKGPTVGATLPLACLGKSKWHQKKASHDWHLGPTCGPNIYRSMGQHCPMLCDVIIMGDDDTDINEEGKWKA